jgi:hypothetical protein
LGGRGRQISEFEASLVYRVSSRTARATQRNPVSKNQKKKKRERDGFLRDCEIRTTQQSMVVCANNPKARLGQDPCPNK